MHQRLLHRQDKVGWQVLNLHLDWIGLHPSIRVESLHPPSAALRLVRRRVVVSDLSALLEFLSDIEVFVDDGNEPLEHTNCISISKTIAVSAGEDSQLANNIHEEMNRITTTVWPRRASTSVAPYKTSIQFSEENTW